MIGLYEFMVVLATCGPALIFWIAVIIFAVVMLRRGGGRAERFIIAGGGVKIAGTLLGVFGAFLPPWLVERGYDINDAVSVSSGHGIAVNIIGMAGIICLIYGFWIKFKAREILGDNVENA
jgi:hypothetical protein